MRVVVFMFFVHGKTIRRMFWRRFNKYLGRFNNLFMHRIGVRVLNGMRMFGDMGNGHWRWRRKA